MRGTFGFASTPICRAPASAPVAQNIKNPTGNPLYIESSRSRTFEAPHTNGR